MLTLIAAFRVKQLILNYLVKKQLLLKDTIKSMVKDRPTGNLTINPDVQSKLKNSKNFLKGDEVAFLYRRI